MNVIKLLIRIANFIFTKTYGIAPSLTELTVRYLTGGGVNANVQANDLTTLIGNIQFLNSNLKIFINLFRLVGLINDLTKL